MIRGGSLLVIVLVVCAPPQAEAQAAPAGGNARTSAEETGARAKSGRGQPRAKRARPAARTQTPKAASARKSAKPARDGAPPAQAAEAEPAPEHTATASDPAVRVSGDAEVKVMEFSGLDIEGQLKTPQMLYFLNRMRAEFGRPRLPHRSFMPELQRSARGKPF
jgi:hypothetical protein